MDWPCAWITAPNTSPTTSNTHSGTGGSPESFAFVEQPQTHGVAERFNRTLKEQLIQRRTYRNVEELRAAVTDFVYTYNTHWRLEKLGFLTPLEARQQYPLPEAT